MSETVCEMWLLDVSGSMAGSRIKFLREAVKSFKCASPHVRLVTFATEIEPIKSFDQLDEITPHGGTNLHLALEHAASLMCGRAVVFTDGEPFDQDACFEAASKVPGVVCAVFCGDEGDKEAKRFCEKLSRDNGGQFVARDIARGQSLMCDEVKAMLGLPAPIPL